MNSIKKARVLREYSAKDFAKWAGISYASLRRIEKAQTPKRADLMLFVGLYAYVNYKNMMKQVPSMVDIIRDLEQQ